MNDCHVRFFCTPGPRSLPWSQLAFDYIEQLERADMPVRIMPLAIGSFLLPFEPPMAHWEDVLEAFTRPVASPYVNVVCSPAGATFGRPLTGRQLAASHANATPDVVMRVETAFEGLYTANVPNVAITGSNPLPKADERVALARYRVICCPTEGDAEVLRAIDLPAFYTPANQLHRVLESILSGLLAPEKPAGQ